MSKSLIKILRIKTAVIVWALVCLYQSNSIFPVSTFSLGMESGYGPNALGMKVDFDALQLANERVFQRAVESRGYYGDRVKIYDIRNDNGEMTTLPFGMNLRFIQNRLFFKLSFLYHVIPVNRRSYVLNTQPGVDNELANAGVAHNFYDDFAKNQDTDLTNDVKLAYGMVPTNGKDYFFQSVSIGEVYEIPFTFGLMLIGREFYKFYLGAGMSFFTGRSVRTISVAEVDQGQIKTLEGLYSAPDIDEFAGNAVGFHFMMGSEFQVTSRIGLYMEFTYSIGAAVPLEDRVRTGGNTTPSLFTSNDALDQGGSEVPGSVTKAGLPRISGLNFEYIRLSFGLSFTLMDNEAVPELSSVKEVITEGNNP